MPHTILEDAHAIILPAFSDAYLSDQCKKFLDHGGISILLGESREEYVARTMSDTRRRNETPETFQTVVSEAKSYSGDLLVAVDQEIGGICRLHDLVPQFPSKEEIASIGPNEIEDIAFRVAHAATEIGVNCFLAPVLDILTGQNPWLQGRTFSIDPNIVSRVSAAYVRGVQRAGVAAAAKHFPGFHNIELDPAISADAIVHESAETFQEGFIPFREAISNQVEMIMVGPAIAQAFDAERAALRSKNVVEMLKVDFAFQGIVIADDLDSKATLRGDLIEQAALDAVNAGCDLLLLADDGKQLDRVATALAEAACDGRISSADLSTSAKKMRQLARKYDPANLG